MSFFLSTVGMGNVDFVSIFGGDTSQATSSLGAASEFNVQYVPLNKELMILIETYYNTETLISAANSIKSYHNLGKGGFEIKFAKTKTIDDDKYHHLSACDVLLEHARRSKDMYGFCIVQDATSNIEQRTKEMLGEPDVDEDDPEGWKYVQNQIPSTTALNGSLPIINLEARLTAMASRYMHRAADALGLEDVRDSILTNVKNFNDIQVNLDSGVAASTQPNNGPALPAELTVGEAFSDRGLAPPTQERSEPTARPVVEEKLSKSKSIEKLFTKIRNLKPVNIRDGRLFLRINKFANQRDIVFCRAVNNNGKPESEILNEEEKALHEKRLPNTVVIDDTVCVYVWPSCMPSDEGQLCTKMYETIMLKNKFNMCDNRLIAADKTNVTPIVPMVYEDKSPQAKIAELSEHDFLNIASKPTQKEEKADKREAIATFLAARAVMAVNAGQEKEYKDGLKQLGSVLPPGEDAYSDKAPDASSGTGGISTMLVPRNFTPTAAISGKSIDDPWQREMRYREHIAEMVGIPLIQLQGGMGNSRSGTAGKSGSGGSAVTAGSASLSDGTSIATIMTDRANLSSFLESVFEVFFRDMSNEELAMILSVTGRESELVKEKHEILLATLREHYEYANAAAKKSIEAKRHDVIRTMSSLIAQFQNIANAAKQVSTLEHRFSLTFLRQTFLGDGEIEKLKLTDAITDLDVANIQRAKCGLPAITEAQFIANKKRRLESQKEEVDSKQPTPEPIDNSQKKRKT